MAVALTEVCTGCGKLLAKNDPAHLHGEKVYCEACHSEGSTITPEMARDPDRCKGCWKKLEEHEPRHVHTEPFRRTFCQQCHEKEVDRENIISKTRMNRRFKNEKTPAIAVLLEGFGILAGLVGLLASPILILIGLFMVILGVVITMSHRR